MKFLKTFEMTPSTKQLIDSDINKHFIVKHKGEKYIAKLISIRKNRNINSPYKFLIGDKNHYLDFYNIIRIAAL